MSRRTFKLPVITPRTYGECIEGTPLTKSLEQRSNGQACEHYECRHNLRTVRSENVPGRRNNGIAPEWTFDSESVASAPSCALDVANRGAHKCSELAAMEGKSKRRWQQEVKAAVKRLSQKLVEAGEDPTDVVEWMLALMQQEREEEMRRK